MSLIWRAALVVLQATFNQTACTPPNKTQAKFRYHTEEPYLLQIAPLVIKAHSIILWWIAILEVAITLNHYFGASLSPSLSAHLDAVLLPTARSQNIITFPFVTGVGLVMMGSYIRTRCFQELGQFFTFDLTMYPEHKLVTSGPYGYVRHPAYTGSMLLIVGITFSHLTRGSLLVDCLLGKVGATLLWAGWWIWAMAVAHSRASAEDKELQKRLGSEWNMYAANVSYCFVPCLL
ncbi:hypothetical protein ID866_7338 [Astraeus odoratus]|nr:hypothetical protein ID866_7338 [Astraeus odoratus]